MNRTDRYVNEESLVDAISRTLLRTWEERVDGTLVERIREEVDHLQEDLRVLVSGISVVGPTRGKMGALSEAVVQFVDSTLGWQSTFVKGGAPDIGAWCRPPSWTHGCTKRTLPPGNGANISIWPISGRSTTTPRATIRSKFEPPSL